MKKKGNEKRKVLLAFVLLLLVALVSDFTGEKVIKKGQIKRSEIGQKKESFQLELYVDGIIEEYPYMLEVEPIFPTKEEAEGYLQEAVQKIENDFVKVGESLPIKQEYIDGKVKADWSFHPFGVVDEDGKINSKKLKSETLIQAQVELNCGTYQKFYDFSFVLEKPKETEEEAFLEEIEMTLDQEMKTEGKENLTLPTQINGKQVEWSEKREYLTPQILLLEGLAILLIGGFSRKKKQEDLKKKIARMEEDYSDIVNQLALLLGAGMTTRQAWSRLGNLYNFKRKKKMVEERDVYEAVLRMNGRFAEGESERVVYQRFCQEIPATGYHKLMRILLGSLEKGNQDVRARLEEESRRAFEQRIVLAKKRGEEASTKMLLPLMLMMVLIMGIIMVPALIQFQM